MGFFNELIGKIEELSWDEPWGKVHCKAEKIFQEAWKDREYLIQVLEKCVASMELPTITRTAELHSWLLYNGKEFCLKLNQFEDSPHTGRHSENIHDHTRPLTSLTLAGGYWQNYFDSKDLRGRYKVGDEFKLHELPGYQGPKTDPGMVYTIDAEVFHALTDFRNGTLTLSLYGKILKESIMVFNTINERVEERITYRSAKSSMLRQLSELRNTAVL